ncbi:MAG: hypothetical protein V2I33_18780 [Kangiellaceae bacterium]|jgi:hypothetical protein|nr:hypothetical protein [Kangiellaceae bacterium]
MAKITSISLEDDHRDLINELVKGEESGFVKNFNKEVFLERLHKNSLS